MPEYSGTLPSFEPTSALWLVPLLPLLAAAICAVWRGDRARPGAVALGGTGAPLALLLWKAVELTSAPIERRTLLDVPWTLLRIGSLDVSFGMSLDVGGALIGIAACVAALGAVIELERRGSATRGELGGCCLALGSLLLVALADNLFVLAIGWQGLGLAALSFARRHVAAGFVPLAPLIGGALILLWGLGGIWTSQGDYVPDFHPRLVHVTPSSDSGARQREARTARGELTIAALPGSKVTLGGAELCRVDERGERGGLASSGRQCREPARTPFARLPVPVALHDVQVSPGPGTNDYLIEKTRIVRGAESQIVLIGSTLSFRELDAQLAIRDVSGVYPLSAALTQKKIFGLPLLALVVIALVGAALLRVRWALVTNAETAAGVLAAAVFGAALAPIAVVRMNAAFVHAPGAASVMAALAAALAVLAAFGALHQRKLSLSISLAIGAQMLVAIGAATLGAGNAALVHVAVNLLAAVALLFASSARSRAFTLGALAASGAPVPLVGVFWSRDSLLWRAFITTEGALVPGFVTYVLLLGASTLVALALWRAHFRAEKKQAAADGRAPLLAGVLALVAGLALVPLGDPAEHESGEWLFGAPRSAPPIDATLRHGSLLIGFALPLIGFLAARRRAGQRDDALPGAALFGKPPSARWAEGFVSRMERAGAAVTRFDRKLEAVFERTRGDGT